MTGPHRQTPAGHDQWADAFGQSCATSRRFCQRCDIGLGETTPACDTHGACRHTTATPRCASSGERKAQTAEKLSDPPIMQPGFMPVAQPAAPPKCWSHWKAPRPTRCCGWILAYFGKLSNYRYDSGFSCPTSEFSFMRSPELFWRWLKIALFPTIDFSISHPSVCTHIFCNTYDIFLFYFISWDPWFLFLLWSPY
jgi:hypothetical protein